MDTIKIHKGNVKLIAHRGVSGLELENTCAAFVAAGNRSYFGIETDVHVTADGKFIIIHDSNTQRVATEAMVVEESSFKAQYLLAEEITKEHIRKMAENGIHLDTHYLALSKALVDTLHSHGILINCWTVDDPAIAEKLVAWGVDQITSNILE